MTTRIVEARKPRQLLARLLDTPNLAAVVRGMDPRVLRQLIRHCGLEDCGEIVGLATTDQLIRIFDDDLWRSGQAGLEDEFDADRFALWLEVLAEVGVAEAARKIAEMDFDFVTGALSRHILVLDSDAAMEARLTVELIEEAGDLTEEARAALTESLLENCLSYDLGGYRLIARQSEGWDTLLPILIDLEEGHRAFFGRLMKRCCRLTTEHIVDNGGLYEVLTADEQVIADVAGDRERRREEEGYVSPSQAVAFLKIARQRPDDGVPPRWDPVTAGYFRDLDHRAKTAGGASNRRATATAGDDAQPRATEQEVAEFLSTLQQGGVRVVKEPRPRLLLKGEAAGPDRLARIRSHLAFAHEKDPAAYTRRTEELNYLANVLMAGCSFQARRFRAGEAADAALAVCNLGLEDWRSSGAATAATANRKLPPGLLLEQDLVGVFRAGWRLLYEDVSLYVAERLVEVLSDLRCDDEEVQDQIMDLSRRLTAQVHAGTPWRERDNLDVIAVLDQPSWATLVGLLDECPVVPRRADRPSARKPLRMTAELEFISENTQVAWVRAFVESLADRLGER